MTNPHLQSSAVRNRLSKAYGDIAVIAVHGRNQKPDFILDLMVKIGLSDLPVLAPAAFEGAWYPQGFMAPLESNQPQLDQSIEAIDSYLSELHSLGFSNREIILLGFSQGACLLSHYALRNPDQFKAIIAFTGGFIGPKGLDWGFKGDFKKTQVYITTSEIDEWVPPERVRETADKFQDLNADVQVRIFKERPHEVSEEEIDEVKNMLTK
ncbi:MAG: dienelactone hydrolase family protein [Flavobacteriia bacterium]|nr:dienelactone hydrolase family protein [Flavobacteriia bacterium]